MPSQWLTMLTLKGQPADFVRDVMTSRRSRPNPRAVDSICDAIIAHRYSPVFLTSSQWIDRWLMGDLVPGPDAIHGNRFQIAAMTSDQAQIWAKRGVGHSHDESIVFANRLREAAIHPFIVVIREVIRASLTDEEWKRESSIVPDWMNLLEFPGSQRVRV